MKPVETLAAGQPGLLYPSANGRQQGSETVLPVVVPKMPRGVLTVFAVVIVPVVLVVVPVMVVVVVGTLCERLSFDADPEVS